MSTPDDTGAEDTQVTPVTAMAPPTRRLGIFDVIDEFGMGYFEGRALEGILNHRPAPADWVEDLTIAQQYLEELKNRLRVHGGAAASVGLVSGVPS